MDITAVREPSTRPTGQNLSSENVDQIGREIFLRLLVTQLQSQDPTSPVENEEFIVQLAQFTTLEQANNTNELLKSLVEQNDRHSQLDLVKLIGHDVVANGNVVSLEESGTSTLSYLLGGEARTVDVRILDSSGAVVRTIREQGPQGAGSHEVVWDGTDADGDRVAPGTYQFDVVATDPRGNAVPVTTFLRDTVKNVIWGQDVPVVTLKSGKTLTSSDILSVEQRP